MGDSSLPGSATSPGVDDAAPRDGVGATPRGPWLVRAVFTNAVPLNGGDEVTLRATIEALKARVPGLTPTVLCNNAALTRTWVTDLEVGTDLELAAFHDSAAPGGATLARLSRSRVGQAALSALPALSPRGRRATLGLYRSADIVLASPGGYLHDHYDVEGRLRSLDVALDLGKPVVLLPQSVGPFWKPGSVARARRVLGRVSRICVRDDASMEHLLELGIDPERILLAADAAFLWRRLAPELFRIKEGAPATVGLCFRAWPFGDRPALERTTENAVDLCRALLAGGDRELLFVSTCQGVPGYVDDSEVALRVVSGLSPSEQARCRVDRLRRRPRDLIRALAGCDAFIGMRLHACICAMLGGTPAMGLGYEEKTAQVFSQLGLSDYQVPFDSGFESWRACADRFMADQPLIRTTLPGALDRAADRAGLAVDAVVECLEERGLTPSRPGAPVPIRPDAER